MEFRRMDFNDITSITNYGIEVLEQVKTLSRNDKNLINVNMKDEELNKLIKGIPLSIDEEIDKNVNANMPIHLTAIDKLLNVGLINALVPNFIKDKLNKEVEEVKDNSEINNSVELYNTIMNNIDNIGIKLQDNYNEAEAVVETLNISKAEIYSLIEVLDEVINVGNNDIETYKNSEIEDELKPKKIELAIKQITSLRKTKDTLLVLIQQKDAVILNLGMYVIEMRDWMLTTYPVLSLGVESAIETKYISNKTNELKDLNDTSKKVILDSAETLKITTEKNVEMLKSGSLDTATINKYLKTVQDALTPVKGYIANKENVTKKLMSELDSIERNIDENNTILTLIQGENITPSIEEPKTLKLEMKNSNNA